MSRNKGMLQAAYHFGSMAPQTAKSDPISATKGRNASTMLIERINDSSLVPRVGVRVVPWAALSFQDN